MSSVPYAPPDTMKNVAATSGQSVSLATGFLTSSGRDCGRVAVLNFRRPPRGCRKTIWGCKWDYIGSSAERPPPVGGSASRLMDRPSRQLYQPHRDGHRNRVTRWGRISTPLFSGRYDTI